MPKTVMGPWYEDIIPKTDGFRIELGRGVHSRHMQSAADVHFDISLLELSLRGDWFLV